METDVSSRLMESSSAISTLEQLLATCRDAFVEDEEAPKVSATTKKRLTARAMQGLQGGTQLVQALAASMRELQQAVQQQQEGMQQALHSNQTLQQQLVSSNDECHSSKRALLQSESQKMGLQQQVEHLQRQLHLATAEKQELQGTIHDLQAELQGAAQQAADARTHLIQLHQQMEQLAAATREAEAGADAAAGALQAAREQADKEQAARVRHEDAVAHLTADNLVFMARLRAAEAGAAAAAAERVELKMALEQHKGPWMDEVHQGVELRVKAAMARAEQLEAQQELAAAQHTQHTQQLQQQQADLEAALQEARQRAADLQAQLEAAHAAASEDRTAAEEAAVLASTGQAAADERAAELRVAQESLRSMREECNERWMSERDARTQSVELQERLDSREAAVTKLKKQLQSRSDDLATQRAVNQQLMLKKEEVEWQLLAAIAQLHTHQAGAASGSPKSISPQESLETKQQAATAAAVSQAAAAPVDSLLSPFVASALLPLSPVHRSPVVQHAAMLIPPAAAGLRVSAGGGATTNVAAAAAAAEVPGPAAVAAGGALWQLPGGSSSGLFGSRVSSSGGAVHPLAALNPMPAATAAAVEALFGNKAYGLHQPAFSAPEGDMYSLPRLGFGLATLPSPEQMFAAAEAAVSGSGSLQKTVTIGRAGSLTVPMSAADGAASSSGGGSASADGAAPAAAAPGSAGLGFLNITREGRTSSGGPGSVTFKPPPSVQPMLLGTTGGLMAPFSTLSPANNGPSSSGGRGAVFPECITASAVTDTEQLELGCFGFSAGLSDALQQHPGFWYLQTQQQQQRQQQPSHQRHGSSGSLSDGGRHVHHSSSPYGSSSGSLHEEAQQQQQQHGGSRGGGAGTAAHKAAAVLHPAAAAVCSGAGAAAAGSGFAAAPAGDAVGGAAEGRGSNDSQENKDEGIDSNAGSNAHLHGILMNGRSSRPRSPLTGVSPSGSMKSVRFSFEGLENASAGAAGGVLAADGDQELPGDQRGGRRSGSSSARRSVSPPTNRGSHGHSGSEWLRQTLYDQLASHNPTTSYGASPRGVAVGSAGSVSSSHGGSHHADHHSSHSSLHHQEQQQRHHSSSSPGGSYGHHHHQAYDPYAARRQHHSSGGGSGSGSSRHGHGWPVSSHPPRSGLHLMGRFADGRQGRHGSSSVQDMIRQQQRQVRHQQVAKEVAAMAAAVKDRVQPKAPVHPIFGVMHTAGDSGSGQQQPAT